MAVCRSIVLLILVILLNSWQWFIFSVWPIFHSSFFGDLNFDIFLKFCNFATNYFQMNWDQPANKHVKLSDNCYHNKLRMVCKCNADHFFRNESAAQPDPIPTGSCCDVPRDFGGRHRDPLNPDGPRPAHGGATPGWAFSDAEARSRQPN